MRKSHLVWVAAFVLGAIAVPVSAQAPKKPLEAKPAVVKPVGQLVSLLDSGTEHKVFAQLVEYLHRDTFPPDTALSGEQRPTSNQLKTFIESRKTTIGFIRTRLRDIKAEPEMYDLFDDYLSVLNAADKHADEIRKYEDEYFRYFKELRQDLQIDIMVRRLQGNANLIRSNASVAAWSIGWHSYWDPYQNRRGILAGSMLIGANCMAANLDFHADVLSMMKQMRNRSEAYEKRNLPILVNKVKAEERRLHAKLEETRPLLLRKGNDAIAKLSAKYGWKSGEVTLKPFDEARQNAMGNPFAPLSSLNRITSISSTREAGSCEAMAEKLIGLVEQMPVGSLDTNNSSVVYNRIRADVSYLAAVHANRASEFQLGSASFKTLKPGTLTSGSIGVKAFELYKETNIDLHPKPQLLYQKALAYAYAGTPTRAYNAVNGILDKELGGMSDPKFFYDCARLRCLGGTPAIPSAMKCLSTAFVLGYKQTEKAQLDDELKLLRVSNPTLFEKAVKAGGD